MEKMTAERLRSLVVYDDEIISFRWRQPMGRYDRFPAGAPLAIHVADGGRYINLDRRKYRINTVVWLYFKGEWPVERLVPIDGDYANDRLDNLCLLSEAHLHGGFKGLKTTRDITAETVRDLFDYDAASGALIWKRKVGTSTRVGAMAGSSGNHGNWAISLGGKDYLRGRLVWLHVKGEWPRSKLIHIDDDKTNDRIENLAESSFTHGDFDLRTREGRNEYTRQHRLNHKDQYRNKDLQRNFGITLAERNAMSEAQDHKCAICRQPETMVRWGKDTPLAVDHDHNTGAVRGLLCHSCNAALGQFKDNEEILASAIAYLRKHATNPTAIAATEGKT